MAEKKPAEGAAAEGEPAGEGEEERKLEYCKEISEEQLTAFYEKAGDNEEAVKYMALDILKLQDITYDGNIGMILDYFVGILMYSIFAFLHTARIFCHGRMARFAQEEKMSAPHTLLMYQLGMETLENIKSGFSIKKTEKKFKDLLFRWSVKVKNTNHVALLTSIEIQKIVPFFMSTVFQHFRLYSYCFSREPLKWKYYEEVFIEFPENILYPLQAFDTMEEIDEDKQAWAEYERARAEWEAERLAAEARAQWLLENPLFPPDPRRPAENLDEYIDFSVRDKVEEVFNIMQEQYDERTSVITGRVQALKENDPNSPYLRRLKLFGIKP